MIQYLKTHIFYVVIIAVGIIAFRSWLLEHDARLQAEQVAKVAEANIATLRTQIATSDAAAAQTIAALKKRATTVKTPEQAITAIPDVSTLPLHATASPQAGFVQVDALALYQELNQCTQDRTALGACQVARAADEKIIEQKDNEIAAYKKPKSFWHRTVSTLKAVGIGVGIGLVLGGHL
jgi:hypothetical protein